MSSKVLPVLALIVLSFQGHAAESDPALKDCTVNRTRTVTECSTVQALLKKGCPGLTLENQKSVMNVNAEVSRMTYEIQECQREFAKPLAACRVAREATQTHCGLAGTKVDSQRTKIEQEKQAVEQSKQELRSEEVGVAKREEDLKLQVQMNMGLQAAHSTMMPTMQFANASLTATNQSLIEMHTQQLRTERLALEEKKQSVQTEEKRVSEAGIKVKQNQDLVKSAKKDLEQTNEVESKAKVAEEIMVTTLAELGKGGGDLRPPLPPSDNSGPDGKRPSEPDRDPPGDFNPQTQGQGTNSQNQNKEEAGFGRLLPDLFSITAETFARPEVSKVDDCSNPQVAANSLICACQQTPNDSRCRGVLAKAETTVNSPATKGSVKSTPTPATATSYGAALSDNAKVEAERKISKTGQLQLKNNGGAKFSSNAGSGLKAKGNSAQPQRRSTYDSGSKGGSAGFYSGPGAGTKGYPSGNNSVPPRQQVGARPGTKISFPLQARARIPSGYAAPDGITGPHTDLFRKVRRGYTRFGDSLMP